MGILTSCDRASAVGGNRLHVRRRMLITVGPFLLVVASAISIVALHFPVVWSPRVSAGLDLGGIAVTRSDSIAQKLRKVVVEPARLESGKIALTDMRLLPVADVGGADVGSKADDGKDNDSVQSDYEPVSSKAEALHPVASVPMDQSAEPTINVPLADVGPTALASRGAQEDGSLARVAAADHSLADIGGSATVLLPLQGQRWSLVDDAPVIVPDVLLKGQSLSDDSLSAFIERWEAASSNGQTAATIAPTLGELSKAVADSKLSWVELYELGRFAACLDGQAVRIPFFRQAIRSEEWSFDDSTASARDLRVMEILVGTFLWAQKDDATAGQGLKVLLDWEKAAGPSVLAQVTLADADLLDRQGGAHERDLLAPLAKLLKSDGAMSQIERLELHWGLGRALFRSGNYAASIPELSTVIQADTACPFTPHAQVLLTLALAKAGNATEAQKAYELWDPQLREAGSSKTDASLQRDVTTVLALLRP